DWAEISRSIIANICDDVRIIILPERTELSVKISFDRKDKDIKGKYNIHPELRELYKIPVAKSRFQIKLVQLMYRKLPEKQRSTDSYRVVRHQIPCSYSPKEVINTLEYCPPDIKEGEKAPAVVFYHGGAYLFPALPYHYRLAAMVAERTGARVFLPMYDLALKYNPPIQIKEGLEVYRYLLSNEEEFGIDVKHVAVMGDSSGGTISAAVCLLARDYGIQAPAGQALLYPSLDTRGNTGSMEKYTDVPVVNSDAIRSYMKIIKSDKEEGVRFYTSPAEATSFEGLPPAYIETAEFDALHDEGVEYADLLEKAGCRVILNNTRGTVHSFDMAKDSTVLKEALNRRMEFLNSVLHEV
ncbi:MAG: alpha/beta hydrolase, partial [Lachnospiraceae bacterium]|nr:alpha/beta hydrolase [Lachnospiraceae bacterium]